MSNSLVEISKSNEVVILLSLIIFDFITGFLKSVLWKVSDSWVSLKGVVKHSMAFILYFMIYGFFHSVGNPSLGVLFIGSITLSYLLSILENLGVMGVPVPKFLETKIKEDIKKYNDKINSL